MDLLTTRYSENLMGVLSCYDRIVITGTLPGACFAAIRSSVRHATEHVQSLSKQAMEQYTVLLMAPTIVTMLTGIGGRMRPLFNVTISNVPGPDKPLYFRGAELLAIYPVSIVTQGQAPNITCQCYAGWMDLGFTGCHPSVPSLQRLAAYTAEALEELEAAFLPRPKPSRKARHPQWVTHNEYGAHTARGIHGQTIYIDPNAETVIARYASFPQAANAYNDPTSLPAYHALAKYLMANPR